MAIDQSSLEVWPSPCVLLDFDGRVLLHNQRFAELIGLPPGAGCQGTSFSGLLTPASQVYFDLGVLPAIQLGQEASEVHLLMRHPHKPEVPVLCFGYPDGSQQIRLVVVPIPERRRLESDLVSIRNAVEQVPGAVFKLAQGASGRLRCEYFSGDALALFGVARTRLHTALWSMMSRHVRRDFAATMRAAASGFTLFQFDIPITSEPTGARRWLHIQARAQLQPTGARLWFGHIMDVSPLKLTEAALAENHELLRVTLESIGDAVITTDTAGRVRWFNPVAERMSGWSTLDVCGRPLDEVLRFTQASPDDPQESVVLSCLRTGLPTPDPQDRLLLSRDGNFYNIEQSAAPIRRSTGEILGAVLVFHDVSRQREIAKENKYRASHDVLTGLVNRSEFEEHLARLLAAQAQQPAEHSLLYIDLDQFKLINDSCGHAAGDTVLREIADILKKAARQRDCVARIGGDEFALILEHCPHGAAEEIGDQICKCMEEYRFLYEGRPFRSGTSIGLVAIDTRWSDVNALMQAADAACYAAKSAGRNRVHCWRDSDTTLRRRSGETQWAARLTEAIDHGRLELFAQRIEPTGGAHGGLHCELLLRMREPDGTIVPPGAFIPAAERFHMATQVDRWVIRRSVEMLATAGSAGAPIELISVNVSGQSISDAAFRLDVAAMLADSGVDASKLCFEITETVIATIGQEAMQFVTAMHERGARIALDDFGVGASWLGNLKKLPVDYLKIDGEFVRDLLVDRLDNVAVRYFQELARTIGARTVAEWVETAAVRAVLEELGVDYVQGFLIHRPEPFADLLRRGVPGAVRSPEGDWPAVSGMRDPVPAHPEGGL